MDIDKLAEDIYAWVDLMGWHNKTELESLALIASEVGEAVNECRGDYPTEKFAEELGDILIRTLDLMEEQGLNISGVLASKMQKNKINGTRGRLK